jgi:hypothetical protein
MDITTIVLGKSSLPDRTYIQTVELIYIIYITELKVTGSFIKHNSYTL